MDRLQKVLSRAGLASRRGAEQLIEQGRVSVNGATVQEMGVKVDPERDTIRVDGKRIPGRASGRTYLMLNKPPGVVTTMSDPEGRPSIGNLIEGLRTPRVFPIGRLDYHSEGLLLLTDDGDLARALMHPGTGVPKTYLIKVKGIPSPEALGRVARGVVLDGRRTRPARIHRARPGANPWLEVTVVEGSKHLVRRMLQAVGHPVLKLRRVAYGGLKLGHLKAGAVRRLRPDEVERLRRAVGSKARAGSA